MYPKELTDSMREELNSVGVKDLVSVEDVDLAFKEPNFLLVVNSVCGCSGASMRPGVVEALEERPIKAYSVFAGVDFDATEHARSKLEGFLPSSPSVFLVKDGEVVFALERSDISSRPYVEIKEDLLKAFSDNNI